MDFPATIPPPTSASTDASASPRGSAFVRPQFRRCPRIASFGAMMTLRPLQPNAPRLLPASSAMRRAVRSGDDRGVQHRADHQRNLPSGRSGLTAPEDAAIYLVRFDSHAALIDAGCGRATNPLGSSSNTMSTWPDRVREARSRIAPCLIDGCSRLRGTCVPEECTR